MSSLSLQYYMTTAEGQLKPLEEAADALVAEQQELIQRMRTATQNIKKGCVIQVVIVSIENFKKGHAFFRHLTGGPLRSIEPMEKSQREQYAPRPVIVVGLYDLMSLYEETAGLDFEDEKQVTYWKDARRERLFLYKQHIDHRVKFLDSSIWHRYVPYQTSCYESAQNRTDSAEWEKSFEAFFAHVVRQMIHFDQQGMYRSVAAVATLEFQCRILHQSFISDFGPGGHHTLVTPFKFHSETQMERKCARFCTFFKDEHKGTRLADLEWHVLMVDDHSDDEMNHIYASDTEDIQRETGNKSSKKRIEHKKEVIRQIFSGEAEGICGIKLHIELESTGGGKKIMEQAIAHLREKPDKKVFEIILLDYLLGDQEVPDLDGEELRAYGHEFLLELATSPERAHFQRGPANRFWIYPISSFPFAFGDKLRQMNLDGTGERWTIANGGDPLSTPALFRLNLYRLLLRQISEYYLHEAAFKRWIGRLGNYTRISEWHRAFKLMIEAEKFKKTRLGDRRTMSVFAASMERFLDAHPWYTALLNRLEQWLPLVANYQPGESPKDLTDALDAMERELNIPQHLIGALREQIEKITSDATKDLAGTAPDKGVVHFEHRDLHFLPENLDSIFQNLTAMYLSGNRLSIIPPDICQCTGLKILHLASNRNLRFLPAAEMLKAMQQQACCLISLDLSDTPLQEKISPHSRVLFANTAEEVRSLLEKIARHNEEYKWQMQTQLRKKDTVKIFICYDKEDDECRQNLRKHLTPAERSGKVVVWDNQSLRLGSGIDEQIRAQIEAAHIFLLVHSPAFVASDYIQHEELPLILQRSDATRIPIHYRITYNEDERLRQLSCLPANGRLKSIRRYEDQDEAYAEIARKLDEFISDSMP